MYNPVSTYRIQFHKGFTFSDFEKIIPYIAKLGIKTIYASPIFEAVPGSMHGYDVTNPLNINPEIGTLQQLRSISKKLKNAGIGWLQDIVPNHMAFHPDNKWLMDVLENGRTSNYADVFDILWDILLYDGKLMVPFLGKPLDEVITAKEIKIAGQQKLVFDYFGQQYPINRQSIERLSKQFTKGNLKAASFIKKVNTDPDLLRQLLNDQHYQLCYWQETDKQINFRRFFTVNGLICLNMQDRSVFNRYHVLIKKLIKGDIFQGLRVDHVDGLYDPKLYLQWLRELAGEDTYIIVEKILEEGEQFPADWPVQGNTGYDFLATINNLFTCRQSKKVFSKFYSSIDPEHRPVSEQVYEKKRLILDSSMQGELDNLCRLFFDLKLADDNETSNIGAEIFKKSIAAILVRCPVYRFYGNTMPLAEEDSAVLEATLRELSENDPLLSSVNDVLENCLLLKPKVESADYCGRALKFYQRLMQFTGPLMAKGVEDTLMYTYNRFIDHNEVGDSPGSFGIKLKEFNEIMLQRQQLWPLSMNATSTHDTKRGEDVRARLNVLTDIAEDWIDQVEKWQKINSSLKTDNVPDINDEYFIYQTIAGAKPMPDQSKDNFEKRLQEYLIKALREAKRNSNWTSPNEKYESATKKFVSELLKPKSDFSKSFKAFHQRVSDFGVINSLAQVVLKYTCPGMPDLYQGCELWDLSMVDPDNRRAVDYEIRNKYLNNNNGWKELWDDRYNGQIKQTLITKLLQIRNTGPETFEKGQYFPLKVKGKYKENILAFARHFELNWYLIILPLHTASICKQASNLMKFDWRDTRIVLPETAPLKWRSLLDNKKGYNENSLTVDELLSGLPLALVQLERSKNDRSAGVLMHITSLPSQFGIGDIGPEAYRFADFLYKSRQRYWQMLPVNPIDKSAGYSPYSATSAMAGNALLISPELLLKDGLLTEDELKQHQSNKSGVDFKVAAEIKKSLFDLAYIKSLNSSFNEVFENYKQSEAWWLDDFALYQYLKERFNDKPWYEWPKEYKLRHKRFLQEVSKEIAIDKIKWLQFVFTKQWQLFKQCCKNKDIAIIGDMPFYISYDSADVWSNPELFKLDKSGQIKRIAGVPPDYFSETGQLWGMPVFNWETMKRNGYEWWIKRIKRNMQFFDLIRLDHFRAFSEYWEVPGGSKNAIKGKWQKGPDDDFFNKLKDELGDLPFIAEDLGEIDDKVYQLRDKFALPGMRILQFAFDEAMPVSEYIPHNYTPNSIAYTGTHDNNTIKGWYEDDIDNKTRERIQQYAGIKVSSKNIHKVMIRMCYASTAKTAIIPIQDILGLDSSARMNVPSSANGNWTWQLPGDALKPKIVKYLQSLSIEYNR
ncbi:MAG TPA: malto-oligosyltrehalose synthase [Mucilaginibacter sp.]